MINAHLKSEITRVQSQTSKFPLKILEPVFLFLQIEKHIPLFSNNTMINTPSNLINHHNQPHQPLKKPITSLLNNGIAILSD